ncbi:hypothetical protein ACJRO7_027392 [Eucalyptus globulus]|uniref:YDG domain-containing protein n=1 Tax=Eucalyptus globulus TaxID=34317 RepID=A0ABD3JX28_EUCGL
MNHKTLQMSKKAMPADISSVRTVFPALGSSSGYTYILQSQSGSVDCRSNTVMKSIRQSTLEKSISCLPAGCRSHSPLPSLAQHQQALFPSKTANLKQDHSGMMVNVEDKNETESIEEGEFVPNKFPNALVKSSMNARDIMCHGNEKNCALQGQSPFDGSKSSILMKNMTRDPRPEKCLLTCRDFPPGCGSHARVKDLMEVFIPDKSCDSSIKNLATAHVYKWRRNKDHADGQGVGAKEAGSQSQLKVQTSSMRTINKECLRKEYSLYNHCNNVNGSNRDTQITIKEAEKIVQCSPEIKKRVGYVHGAMQFIGDVPGVEVGDKFYYRMELAVVGLHRPPQNGIDYMGPHPDILATSVVASWDYPDDLTHPEELVYLGQGGMPGHDKKAEDQKLTRGNLALMNSMKRNRPVRVIRKDKNDTLTYDGLYVVDKCRKIRRANRQMVFEFLMKRLPGQPEILQKKKMKVLKSSG